MACLRLCPNEVDLHHGKLNCVEHVQQHHGEQNHHYLLSYLQRWLQSGIMKNAQLLSP
jgi:hypothetical protein